MPSDSVYCFDCGHDMDYHCDGDGKIGECNLGDCGCVDFRE